MKILFLGGNMARDKDGILLLENLKKNIDMGDVTLTNFINLTSAEKELVLTWRNNENVRMWMYSGHIISPDEHSMFIERLINYDKNSYWLARDKEEYAGVICLNRIDLMNKNAYIGIYSNPELPGVGEVLMECLKKLAFDTLNLHTLKLEVIETNERAMNFYKKAGFSKEGILKEFVFKDSRWLDVIVMGIINRDRE